MLWILAVLLAFNRLSIGRWVREVLDMQRNVAVAQAIQWLIVILFVAALLSLAVALFRFDRARKRSYPFKFIVLFVGGATLALALTIPLGTVRFGSCGGLKETRLSVLGGDRQKFEDYKREANEAVLKREQSRKAMQERGFIIEEGCSVGPVYVLYLL